MSKPEALTQEAWDAALNALNEEDGFSDFYEAEHDQRIHVAVARAIMSASASARSNFLTMQGAAAELLKRAEKAEAEKKAIITLLYTDDVFVGSHWEDYPNAEKGIWPVLCANVQSLGADAEEIPEEWVIPLADLIDIYGSGAIQAWVCFMRDTDKPIKGSLSEKGVQALAAIRNRGK